jgi:hypothetical protein
VGIGHFENGPVVLDVSLDLVIKRQLTSPNPPLAKSALRQGGMRLKILRSSRTRP